jgi:plastocyanin
MTRIATVAACALALAPLAACGSEGSAESGSGALRTVEVRASDALRFDPATVAAKPGEKVTFRIVNTGAQVHEFVIGDAAFHEAHEKAMSGGGGHGGHHAAGGGAVEVAAGQTATLTYTMPDEAPTYACHISQHDDAGMKGTVTY